MSYTPTTWVTGDTVTATKLNKMEQGIANAGGGVDLIIYTDSNNNAAGYGDLDAALAKLRSGIPISAFNYYGSHGSGVFSGGAYPTIMGWEYDTNYPNQIKLFISSVEGYIWDSNGLTWWD